MFSLLMLRYGDSCLTVTALYTAYNDALPSAT